MSARTKPTALEMAGQENGTPGRNTPELTRRAYLNILATGFDFGVKTLVTLILNPILVSRLGSTLFGIWQILVRTVVYITPTDRGPAQALKWQIASRQSFGDDEAKRRDVGSALIVWLLFVPLVLAAGALLIWLAPTVTKASPDLQTLTRATALLLVLNYLLNGVVVLPDVILRGMNLGYKRMGLRGILAILAGVLMAGAVYLGQGLVGLAIAQLVTTALTGVVFWRVARQHVSWLGFARPQKAEVRRFFSISVWFFGSILVSTILNLSDVVILGTILSANAVTTYVLTYYPAQMIISVTSIVVGGVLPGLGGVIGGGNLEQATLVRSEIMAASWLLMTAMGATAIIWNHSFLTLWVGQKQFAGQLVTLLSVLFAAQVIITQNDENIIDLTLDVRKKTLLSLIAAGTSVILASLMTQRWGIAGLIVGLMLGRAVVTLTYPSIIGAYLSISWSRQLRFVVRPFLTLVGMFGIAYALGTLVLVEGWFVFFAGVSATAVAALTTAWVLGLDGLMRRRLLRRSEVALAMVRQRLLT